MNELKPCPFCGQNPEYIYSESSIKHDSHVIRCVDPGCICIVRPEAEVMVDSDITTAEGYDFAADEWNRRPLEEALESRVKELEAELAQAKAAAVQWVTYTGEPETLPGIGMTVLYDAGEDGSTVVYYRRSPENRTWCHYEFGTGDFEVEVGDRWAYLPAPPDAAQSAEGA